MDDVEAIKQLKARYFRYMDTKAWDELAQVFAEDCTIDTSSSGGGVQVGRDQFLHMLRASIEEVTTVHHGHMPEITVTSPTTATGIWAMEDLLWWPEGSPITHLHGYGHYHETYTLGDDGHWRIQTLTLTRLRTDMSFADPNP